MNTLQGAIRSVFVSLTFLAIGVAAQLPIPLSLAGEAAQASASLSAADKSFIMEAAGGGQAEVELGQLAKDKGDSETVRSFGQHMIDDHSKANKELAALAARKGVAVPTELKAKHKSLKDSLAKLSGAAFDKKYMSEMVKDHVTDVAAFEKEAAHGKDGELTTWVGGILPTLKSHLSMAREAEAKVKTGAK